MAVRFNCSSCGIPIMVKFLKAGEMARCGSCGADSKIPTEGESVPDHEVDSHRPIDQTEDTVFDSADPLDLSRWAIYIALAFYVLGYFNFLTHLIFDDDLILKAPWNFQSLLIALAVFVGSALCVWPFISKRISEGGHQVLWYLMVGAHSLAILSWFLTLMMSGIFGVGPRASDTFMFWTSVVTLVALFSIRRDPQRKGFETRDILKHMAIAAIFFTAVGGIVAIGGV